MGPDASAIMKRFEIVWCGEASCRGWWWWWWCVVVATAVAKEWAHRMNKLNILNEVVTCFNYAEVSTRRSQIVYSLAPRKSKIATYETIMWDNYINFQEIGRLPSTNGKSIHKRRTTKIARQLFRFTFFCGIRMPHIIFDGIVDACWMDDAAFSLTDNFN